MERILHFNLSKILNRKHSPAGIAPTGDYIWSINESALAEMAFKIEHGDIKAAMEAYSQLMQANVQPEKPYLMEGTKAIIPVTGVIMKEDGFWCYWMGGTSMQWLIATCDVAEHDPDVESAKFIFDTPGGMVAGVADGAKAIRKLRAVKPVTGEAQDCCCSSGYWLLSQCSQISANAPTAMIGNIGVRLCVDDISKMLAQYGVTREVIVSAPLKATGVPGIPISAAHRKEMQGQVDAIAKAFVADVALGRGVDLAKAQSWATAHTYLGIEALESGLIDSIDTDVSIIAASDGSDMGDISDCDGDEDDLEAKAPPVIPEARADPPPIPQTIPDTPLASAPSGAEAFSHPAPEQVREMAPEAIVPMASHQQEPPAAVPGAGERQTFTMSSLKENVVNALTHFRLNLMAVRVQAEVQDADNQDAISAAIARSVDAQVEAKVNEHPMFMVCRAAGLNTPDDVQRKLEMAVVGETALKDIRTEAKTLAVEAYGEANGPIASANVDTMNFLQATIARDSFKAMTNAKWGFDKDGNPTEKAQRQSAPASQAEALPATAGTTQTPKTNWDKLSAEQRSYASSKLGVNTPDKQEKFAANVLGGDLVTA